MLRLSHIENLTKDLAIFRFEQEDGSQLPSFKPGQFVPLGVNIDDTKIFRDYSITSDPAERNYYEFYIKHKEHPMEGKFTSKLFQMNLGETVLWENPRGVFTIEEKHDNSKETRQMVLVASGTGIAPFISYVRFLAKSQQPHRVILLHGASYPAELGYGDLLEGFSAQNNNLDLTYVPTISRPDDPKSKNWSGNTGRVESLVSGIGIHKSKLETIISSELTPDNSIFYLCGYKGMTDSVSSLLSDAGFVSIRKKRDDGTFDIKLELYGV